MLKRVCIVGLVLLIASVQSPEASQAPIVGARKQNSQPEKPAAGRNNKAGHEERGTNSLPLIVQVRSTGEADKEAADIANDANEEAANNKLLIGLTGFLGLAAILQWSALLWQGSLTRRSINEASKQHTISNRAFVFLRAFLYTPTGSTDQVEYWRITPVFENSGHTSAIRMISGHSAELRNTELTTYPDTRFPPDGKPFALSRDFIGPHAQINGSPYILSITDILAIKKGEKRFYIWGWCDYDDIFDGTGRHRTEYCYQLFVMLDPTNPKNSTALAMGLSGTYNSVDDQCSRPPAEYTVA